MLLWGDSNSRRVAVPAQRPRDEPTRSIKEFKGKISVKISISGNDLRHCPLRVHRNKHSVWLAGSSIVLSTRFVFFEREKYMPAWLDRSDPLLGAKPNI